MTFIKYPSLTNHYVARKQNFINLDDDYVSTEKIHGSNISIIVDQENNIKLAKRTALLTTEERTQRPWNTLAEFVTEQKDLVLSWTNTVRKLAEKHGHIVQVNFYGELYGSEVFKGSQMQYQEIIDNVRRIRFFDIHVIFEDDRRLALSQEHMTTILGDEYTVPVLRQGKLVDLLLSAEELQSKLGNCVAEGQVYKPKNDYFFKPDDYGTIQYPVIRQKYDAWLETQSIEVKHSMNHSANELKLMTAIESRMTHQRLMNVLSHGDIQPTLQNTGLVIKEMLQDIKEEIIKEEPDININSDKLFAKQGGKIATLYKQYLADSE